MFVNKILEQLLQSENENRWRDLLIDLKNFLRIEKARHGFDIYKFVGDGWILLFDEDFPAEDLFALLRRLSEAYGHSFVQRINRVLSNRIDSIGLTFGLELGSLIRFEINENTEFIGRAINVASKNLEVRGKSISSITANEFLLVQSSNPVQANYYLALPSNRHFRYYSRFGKTLNVDHPFNKSTTDQVIIDFGNQYPTVIEYGTLAASLVINKGNSPRNRIGAYKASKWKPRGRNGGRAPEALATILMIST